MPVTIGIDPNKSTHTAVAVDRHEQQIAILTLPANEHQATRWSPGPNLSTTNECVVLCGLVGETECARGARV